MGLIGKVLTGTALVAGGIVVGTGLAKDNDYKITRSGDDVFLKDRDTKKEYVLTRTEGETYMGNATHNFEGAFVLGSQEITKGTVSADSLKKSFMDVYQGGK
ncbi:hypothetical protein K9M74_00835 [Candidatus Woesearchaeota archaeon]|nr:hypothetical protein [Candidatus Woesearchaeota archaeon]